MNSSVHSIQDVMAGEEILRAMPIHLDPPAQYPADAGASFADVADFVVMQIGGFNVTVMGCAGCTSFSGSLKVVPTAATELHWASDDESRMAIAGLDSVTLGNIARTKSAFALCRDLLSARRGLLTAEQISALERQLESLLAEIDEFEASGITISPTSLDGLIEFLALHRPETHPNISVTRDGRFTASWLRGRRAKVTLVFDREGGDWIGVDLESRAPVRQAGAFVVNSLAGISQPFRSWIKA